VKDRLRANDLDQLFSALKSSGYSLLGPRVHNGAIIYSNIDSSHDLPRGWTDEQEAGTYRLKKTESAAYFGFASSPQSWKQFLFPSRERLVRAEKKPGGRITFVSEEPDTQKRAFIGVRACDIVAISIQDRIFIDSQIQDPSYKARRENSLLVAVECTSSGATCFCASMKTGPGVRGGYDLVLTEVVHERDHYFIIRAGSESGETLLEQLSQTGVLLESGPEDQAHAQAVVKTAASSQKRKMDAPGARDLLARSFDHKRWDEVATRCLNCANCTLVCPTCFCANVEDHSDLTGDHAERWRRWDSCFTLDHSYIHGGSVRMSAQSRYRQWLTHKVSTWWDQFGTTGCVGCGRCITWCPVGIDIVEEVRAIGKDENDRGTTQGASLFRGVA